jgi:dUTP pyrophosphatase
MKELKVKLTHPAAVLPAQGHEGDAGYDLTLVEIVKEIDPGRVYLYNTGVSVEPEQGYHTEVVPRSSTSKMPISLANGTGIIDEHYRGNIMLAIRFHKSNNRPMIPEDLIGLRIGQLLIRKTETPTIIKVSELSDTIRGEDGFGSTGQ